MAKRKAVIKNIIYELDNDDIEISSEDEVSDPKVIRIDSQISDKNTETLIQIESNGAEVLSVDSTDDSICLVDSPNASINGGKTNSRVVETIDSPDLANIGDENLQNEIEEDCVVESNLDKNKTVLSEDSEIESPPTLSTAGCENKIPLVRIRFKNSKLLNKCRIELKDFIISLLKQHQEDNLADSDHGIDHKLDIWPEDLIEESVEEDNLQTKDNKIDDDNDNGDGLFFEDTAPCSIFINDIPRYRQAHMLMSNVPEKELAPPNIFRRGPTCFNCDGAHPLRECKYPRNHKRIAEKRQQTTRVGRYHIEDDQKYGHLIPGRISGQLRHAMGLKRNEIPLHVYRMRLLGYPPGWLEEARISHSGISMFDSTGTAILDPEEEDGEICEAGSKDKFDIKKILDFPGFNVPASSRYLEEAYLYGLPPMSEQDSKISMLQMLAPNAMKAYKRKKLTFFPSANNDSFKEGQAEMDLDSGDDEAVFPSVPPLPDEAPPPLPPPPEQPPPPLTSPPHPLPPAEPEPTNATIKDTADLDTSDVEITSVIQVTDIPIPEDSIIDIDECYDSEIQDFEKSSLSLDELEKKKQDLLKALGDETSIKCADTSLSDDANGGIIESSNAIEETEIQKERSIEKNDEDKTDEKEILVEDSSMTVVEPSLKEMNVKDIQESSTVADSVCTPEAKTGRVKTTSFGTPVLNIASSFVKLPTDDKFSKQICDVINFENLPNSTGRYKKICTLLKKVKTEVDRIQDS